VLYGQASRAISIG